MLLGESIVARPRYVSPQLNGLQLVPTLSYGVSELQIYENPDVNTQVSQIANVTLVSHPQEEGKLSPKRLRTPALEPATNMFHKGAPPD